MRQILLFVCAVACLDAKSVEIVTLATTDLHGHLLPYDYFTATEAGRGLATLGPVIRRMQRENPNVLLIDCGDTIQGSPLEGTYQNRFSKGEPVPGGDPMMLAMNALGYDAMVLGNHEFNYGLRNIEAARRTAKFPWLSANTNGGSHPFLPYIVKTFDGVKVAVIGITTPAIPAWEKPENYAGYEFRPGVEALKAAIQKVSADVVIVAAHSGLPGRGDVPGENVANQLAQVPGVDVVVFGHTHAEVEQKLAGNVLMVQPKNWGISMAEIRIRLDNGTGKWKIVSKTSRLIRQSPHMNADEEIARIAAPYHATAEKELNDRVAEAPVTLSAAESTERDTAILDAIQVVQLAAAKADVSFTSPLNVKAVIAKGPVTVRQIAALYVYDNELYAVEGTGKMVREALENAARFYDGGMYSYNFDAAAGVSYEIDASKPAGSRIVNLRFHGQPLSDDQKLRIAINNYRAGGSGGYTMWPGAKIVWRSYDTVRDLMIRYYSAGNPLPSAPDENWRVVGRAKPVR